MGGTAVTVQVEAGDTYSYMNHDVMEGPRELDHSRVRSLLRGETEA